MNVSSKISLSEFMKGSFSAIQSFSEFMNEGKHISLLELIKLDDFPGFTGLGRQPILNQWFCEGGTIADFSYGTYYCVVFEHRFSGPKLHKFLPDARVLVSRRHSGTVIIADTPSKEFPYGAEIEMQVGHFTQHPTQSPSSWL